MHNIQYSSSTNNSKNIQSIILNLQNFWMKHECNILPQYDMEMGAGTFHPETVFRSITKKNWNCAFIQASRRPVDGRYGDNPNRLQKFHQFQVTLKPSPQNIQNLVLDSFQAIGMNIYDNDVRFIEDNWESPTLGAAGIGWEVQFNGMEILQFTYFQQFAGIECHPVTVELTYGIERIAMCIQNVWNVYDLQWSNSTKYGELFLIQEKECSKFNFETANISLLFEEFKQFENECNRLLSQNIIIPAYEYCIKASHTFNLLEARGVIGTAERYNYVLKIRELSSKCAKQYLQHHEQT